MSPAMAAGVSDRLWDMHDIVALVEAAEPKPGKRGIYKKVQRSVRALATANVHATF